MRWELEHTIVGCNTWMEFLEERKKDKFSETYVENKINKRETQRSRSHKFIKP